MKKRFFLIASVLFLYLLLMSMTVSAANNPYPTYNWYNSQEDYQIACTWYAWNQVYTRLGIALPAWGNGGQWLDNAKNSGYATGTTPLPNSLAVYNGYDAWGHVEYVTAVNGNMITVNTGGYNPSTPPGTRDGWTKSGIVGQNNLKGYIYLGDKPPVSVVFSPWENGNYTYIKETDAAIGQQIEVYNGTGYTAGMMLFDEYGQYLGQATDNYYYRVYFKINEELGITLEPGTTYKYRFFVIVDGMDYWGEDGSFTTLGQKTNPENVEVSEENNYHTDKKTSDSTVYDYQSVTQNITWETEQDNVSYDNITESPSYDTTETLAETSYDNSQETYEEEQETEPETVAPTVNFSKWENGNYTYIKDTDASIGQQIDVYDGECTEAGMYLYDKDGNELGSSDGEYYYRVYFKINEELGVQLEPGTKYKYKFYAVVNGETYWGKEGSFKTKENANTPTVNFSKWENGNYTYIRETDASIGQQIDVEGGECTEAGMCLYDKDGNELGSSGGEYYYRVYFKINEELGVELEPGTKYKYKFYAVVNGKTYWGKEGSFKTNG